MNLALFGGTFDPIHRGHLKVARAAADHFALKEVWFVPADIPPHKQKEPITAVRTSLCHDGAGGQRREAIHSFAAGSSDLNVAGQRSSGPAIPSRRCAG